MKIRVSLTAALTLAAVLMTTHSATSGFDCSRMQIIARDPAKVEYLKRWIDQKIHTRQFLARMGRYNELSRFVADPQDFAEVQLDLAFLGMNPEYAGVTLNRNYDANFMDPGNIKSVTFSQARDDLIIRINNASNFGSTGYDRDLRDELKQISKDVWILCG